MSLPMMTVGKRRRVGWFFGLPLLFLIVVGATLLGLPSAAAFWVHVHLGYYFSLGALLALCWFSYRCNSRADFLSYGQAHWPGLLLSLVAGLSLQFFQDSQMRFYNEEPQQQILAESMHEGRKVSRPQVGYYLQGQTSYGASRLVGQDLYFYPFLVSLVHDLTGFRVANGWGVNVILGVAFYLLIYLIGTRLHPAGGGLFAVLLAASLPILDGVATSYGDDLANVTSLALLFLVSLHYVRRPGANELGLFITAGLILALNQIESAYYLLYVIGVVGGVSCRRRGSVDLVWFVPVSLIFLFPILAAQKISHAFKLAKDLGSLASDGIMPVSALPDHLIRLGAWLFNLSPVVPTSPLLSFFGLIGGVTLVTIILISVIMRRAIHPHTWLVLCFSAVVSGIYLFTSGERGGDSEIESAAGSFLPLHLLFLILAVWWLLGLKASARFTRGLLFTVAVIVFVFGLPARMASPLGNDAAFAQHADWALEWLAENDFSETLYVTPLSSFFLLHDYATVDWRLAESNIGNLMQLVREGYYQQVVGFVIERYDAKSDSWAAVEPTKPFSDLIITRDIGLRRYAYNTRARFFEIQGYIDEQGATLRPQDLAYLKEQDYATADEYIQLMYSIHPKYR